MFVSCEENMPIVPPLGPQTIGDRKVVIEEFTGVRCVQCPAGSAEIENLLVRFPNNLIAVSLHASSDFSPPYGNSLYDFRTPEGTSIAQNIFTSEPLAYPSAAIDRKPNSLGYFFYGRDEWAGLIEDELNEGAQASINLEKEYDSSTRILKVSARVVPLRKFAENVRFTVLITESGIVDAQVLPGMGVVTNYVHKHVFRGTITSYDGDNLGQLPNGVTVEKNYEFRIPDSWNAENCEVVAFMHLSGTSKEIIQAEQVHLAD